MTETSKTAFTINGKAVDVAPIAPLRVKDWRELAKHGITIDKLDAGDVDVMARVAYYCAHKVNESIQHLDVDELTIQELAALINACVRDTRGEGADPS